MKKVIAFIVLLVVFTISLITLTGCTLQIETSDNSVSASVDGDTTERVDSIIDWIKSRINRIFNTSEKEQKSTTTNI